MSISFGGLGLMSLRNPFAELVGMDLGNGDVRSMFCLIVFCIISFVLAYLTNPSENSFRAYLTEQSFRQHLSRLDDSNDEESTQDKLSSRSLPLTRTAPGIAQPHSFDPSAPFHFANRASVSLRTPKHVFHSFAVFTIAAMIPISKPDGQNRDGWVISDSWYIGAFGKWWRGGVLETWYQDVIARSKDEESWSSGILGMKSLDMLHDYNGPTFPSKAFPPHHTRGSPPRLRNRERPVQRALALPARSSTPPPLPKTVSLPLHSARSSLASPDRACALSQQVSHVHTQTSSPDTSQQSVPSRSPSTLFDQSPRIADILRKISVSKSSVLELRTQLADCQSGAAHSHILLQEEVNSYRDRKRQEDATKQELKGRTKTLEDSKRTAESMKRDAEKKLKAAENVRDKASLKIVDLDKQILLFHRHVHDDEAYLQNLRTNASETQNEMTKAVDDVKQEIKESEKAVGVLVQRSKELEEILTRERERLRVLKEGSESRKHDRHLSLETTAIHHNLERWPSFSSGASSNPTGLSGSNVGMKDPMPDLSAFLTRRPSIPQERSPTTTRSVTNFSNTLMSMDNGAVQGAHSVRYSMSGDHLMNSKNTHIKGNRNIFSDSDGSRSRQLPSSLPPNSQLLIPSGLMTSLDNADGISRSFQSESDVYLDKDWRGNSGSFSYGFPSDGSIPGYMSSTSPTSLHGEHDPFEVRPPPAQDLRWDHISAETSMDMQRASWTHHSSSDHSTQIYTPDDTNSTGTNNFGSLRWFLPSMDKPKTGLNPDAKSFNLFKKSRPTGVPPSRSFDALNPNGLGPAVLSSSASTNSSLIRAFAPSPAEREALQRALGGSSNTSFERLPSLSDVGSIPSSPSHVQVLPQPDGNGNGKALPSWLQSLPRIRKVNFSPWDDEEEPKSSNVR